MESNQDQLIVNEKPDVNLKHRYWGGGGDKNSKFELKNTHCKQASEQDDAEDSTKLHELILEIILSRCTFETAASCSSNSNLWGHCFPKRVVSKKKG